VQTYIIIGITKGARVACPPLIEVLAHSGKIKILAGKKKNCHGFNV